MMLIALLAVIGVDLIVIIVFMGLVLMRRRWVTRQPGAFRGAIRVSSGQIDGLHPKWRRGYGRWVRDILVWTKAPFLFRNEFLPADGIDGQTTAKPADVKRLGDHPLAIRIKTGTAIVEVAARADDRELITGPYRSSADSGGV
jgi:hypothetical protein